MIDKFIDNRRIHSLIDIHLLITDTHNLKNKFKKRIKKKELRGVWARGVGARARRDRGRGLGE